MGDFETHQGPPADEDSGRWAWLSRAWADLVWGSRCVGCHAPGPAMCPVCEGKLRAPWQGLTPGHVRTVAAGLYEGPLRSTILAHKERGVRELGSCLSDLLADAVRSLGVVSSTILVPVPSRAAALRARGDDPWGRVVRGAARRLCEEGAPTRVAPLLGVRGTVRDQAGLDVVQRMQNLEGAMRVDAGALARTARRTPPSMVVLCDDVLTTGATAAEGVRALESAGVTVYGCAVVARVPQRARPARRSTSGQGDVGAIGDDFSL